MTMLHSSDSTNNSTNLPPVSANDFLPPISRWTTTGGLVLIGIMGMALAIASVAKYKVTVKAPASIRPAGELRIVQAATSGTVTHILTKENQAIQTGDVIAMIDDSQLQTKKSQLQSATQQAQLQIVQVNAQIQALSDQLGAEKDRMNRAIAASEAELSQQSRDYQDQQISTAMEVEEAEAEVRSAVASLGAAESRYHRYQPVAQAGALSRDQLEEAHLAVQQQEQAVEAAQARLQRLRAMLNPSAANVAIATERIAQEQATGAATLAALNKEREALIQQRVEMQKQLEQDTRELQQVETDLRQTAIAATSDGILATLNLRNPGQTVSAGETIAQIIPDDTPLQIRAFVPPEHRSKLNEGQSALMRVSACAYPDYGTLKGTVSQISEDTIKTQADSASSRNPRTSEAGGNTPPIYEVTIEPTSPVLKRGTDQCVIEVGMEGTVDVISREETVLQFFLRKARLIADG
ncbi:MAG: HlyD family secretion protein [Elainellaceae cyanobacterium]